MMDILCRLSYRGLGRTTRFVQSVVGGDFVRVAKQSQVRLRQAVDHPPLGRIKVSKRIESENCNRRTVWSNNSLLFERYGFIISFSRSFVCSEAKELHIPRGYSIDVNI
jgi:hypothetical protein